ncbi:3D domain-containing protein [Paenibacillus filicis]|uniref:3D domain-containing protein n=1 Tax=Paenibacillus gyeongsangnamensis TaxID=3388067 RepID=A0ABT4QLE3_9BACL|nr:3D domain-containing protein [Paenibacillus filicis]MCZ8517693.1 3D domain-containing protein [Paenibacillus filicis]
MNVRKMLAGCIPLFILMLLAGSMTAFAYNADDDPAEALPDPAFVARMIGPVLPPPVESSPAELPARLQYQVAAGDTLYKIARSFGISVSDLVAENALSDPNQLSIGDRLQIPPLNEGIALPSGQTALIHQVMTTTLTAYTAGFESTGKTPNSSGYGITYSGSKAEEGRTIAVDPSVIPIGSKVFIDGIGVRQAEDIGSAIRGSRIDIFMKDLADAREFGVKKNVKVYVLSTDAV